MLTKILYRCPWPQYFPIQVKCVNSKIHPTERETFSIWFRYQNELNSFKMRKQHICLFQLNSKYVWFERNANMLQRAHLIAFSKWQIGKRTENWTFQNLIWSVWNFPILVCRHTFQFEWGREKAYEWKKIFSIQTYSQFLAQPHIIVSNSNKMRFSFSLQKKKSNIVCTMHICVENNWKIDKQKHTWNNE